MPRVLTPREIGLPEKFDSWRPKQEDGLEFLQTSKTRVKAPCAPTGSGKSPLVVADALLHPNEPTCIVTATKGLQKQYLDDFEKVGMVSLMGRNNYTCKMREGYTCEDGYNARCPYKGTVACDCSAAEMRAATSSLVVTNYAKWTAAKKYGQGMSHFKRVVFDEAHNAPAALAQAMQVVLNTREIEDGLGLSFLGGTASESMEQWKQWAIYARALADAAMVAAKARITGVSDPKPAWVRHYSHMRNLCRRLGILALCRASDWVVEEMKEGAGFQFDPVRPGRYAEAMLFMRMPDITMISATLRPKTLFMCGLPQTSFTFREYDSDFDPKRCPIYYVPVMRVDKRSGDLGMLWIKVDQIAAKRRHWKGIIHTVSFVRQGEIKQRSRFFESMIVNPQGSPTSQTVQDFKESGPGSILVSPSVGEGYDFPGDECRWQFMCKIPFEPPSKIVKAREADDPEYRAYQAMQQLVQSFGRGMRSDKDYCVAPETRILTRDLRWIQAQHLSVGTKLVGFDEYPTRQTANKFNIPRRWQESEVTRKSQAVSERVMITHSEGIFTCTPEHPLLVQDTGRVSRWVKAYNLKIGDKLVKILNTWEEATSFDAGWMSGFTDGEGCLQIGANPDRAGIQGIYLAQNEGKALTEAECNLIRFGFQYSFQNRKADCKVLKLTGGIPEILRFLGYFRPVRLMDKWLKHQLRERLVAHSSPEVLKVEHISSGPIIRLATSSHTYISDGLASHNCENFISDQHLDWFLPRYGHLAPRSFHGFFRRVDILPQPGVV